MFPPSAAPPSKTKNPHRMARGNDRPQGPLISSKSDFYINGRAGLLASGSAPLHAFPGKYAQWREAITPVTAAGPRRSHTGFPILPFGHPANYSVSGDTLFEGDARVKPGRDRERNKSADRWGLVNQVLRYSKSYKDDIYLLKRLKRHL